MNKNLTTILVVLFIGLFTLVGIALGNYASKTLAVETPIASCPITMTEIIASAQGDVYNTAEYSDDSEPESSYLVFYSVQGSTLTEPILETVPAYLKDEQINSALQKEAWEIFTDLIPSQDREMVTQFNIFTDGNSNTLAAVDQVKENPRQWMLEIDVADLEDKDALMFTMIHEYAHILTLNASQMEPDQEIVDDPANQSLQKEKTAACPYYFTGMGCSHADSYINIFYNRFWVDVNDEWKKVDALQYGAEDQTPYYDGLYNFYRSHRDQFLDDYSVTHPTEDIAEAFAYFVFSSKPTGNSIKEQKIAFFYEYPELIQLRENILSGTCSVDQ